MPRFISQRPRTPTDMPQQPRWKQDDPIADACKRWSLRSMPDVVSATVTSRCPQW